jgi:transcriptional regulator with XRE-family HTH domain
MKYSAEELGRHIREARIAKGMNQRELGSHIKCDGAGVSRIEAGKRHLRIDQAARLSEVLGLDLGEVLGLSVSPAREVGLSAELGILADRLTAVAKSVDGQVSGPTVGSPILPTPFRISDSIVQAIADHMPSDIQYCDEHDEHEWHCMAGDGHTVNRDDYAAHVAAAIREVHTVRTVSELNELPDGTLILDHDFEVAAKDEFGWHAWGEESGETLVDLEAWVPALVIHHPSWPEPGADTWLSEAAGGAA